MVLFTAPMSARADYLYSFSGHDYFTHAENTFSFTEPALITTTGTFATSFTIGANTFNYGYFDSRYDCFVFTTGAAAECSLPGVEDSFFSGIPFAVAVGTYAALIDSCTPSGAWACEILDSLTISGSPAPTPEPGSVMLLGSGVLILAGTMRRRLVR
jgi:hypothetical protein